MRDQKVFCVFSGLGILSKNKNTAFGIQLKVFSLEAGSILISDQVAQVFVQLGLENPKDTGSMISLDCLLQIILTVKHYIQ